MQSKSKQKNIVGAKYLTKAILFSHNFCVN